ncbi:DUF3237 domain-containing protein [Mycobacterium sp. Y57]|uniref:DUF3237 domain-containing protein n=1 Tax=Mycolicibacterium xanthum TaxID=2796469 RepID=UPI001C85F65F|nr:DUF3237 domain-containing protein [Mycolicibacterium xanthum]MBX7434023.1 DUF3237 domain-containing protein [Mycolicibacterium xanthum]
MSGSIVGQLPELDALPVVHVCDIAVELRPAQVVPTHLGTRLTFVATGGVVSGPDLRGEILPGGGDWLLIGGDGVGRVDVRATIRAHDGALIHFESRGVIKIPPDGMQRLADGQALAFGETYIRTTPVFETADPRYDWLSHCVAVGYNMLSPGHVDYRVYRLS